MFAKETIQAEGIEFPKLDTFPLTFQSIVRSISHPSAVVQSPKCERQNDFSLCLSITSKCVVDRIDFQKTKVEEKD